MSEDAPANTATAEKKLPKDLAAEKGMVNVQIDGEWLQVPRGTRMIEAAKLVGKEVPHYCYHPKLSSPGNCRMCLVQMGMPPRPAPGQPPVYGDDGYQEIDWMPRPVIACANTVAENMGIRTTGDLVEKTREGVMEFLLINHPLDCPICDQAGECKLQEFSVEHGRGESRFKETKIKKPKNVDIGKNIRLDDERCIMCSRCIRFMDEVAEEPVLGFSQRGTHTSVTVHPGYRLDNNYSLNTADICPVGALTSNDFRFQMRVWFLKETKSIDINCGTGANTVIWTRGNEIFRVTPRQNDDVNSAWMPDNHRLSFNHFQTDNRLTGPLVKKDGKHVQSSWLEATARAAEGLGMSQPDEVAVIASGRLSNEELFLSKKIAAALGTELLTIVPRIEESDGKLISADRNPNTTGAALIWGTDDPAAKLDAIREGVSAGKIKSLIVLSEDLLEEAGFKSEDLEKLNHLVVSHTHANPTAAHANVVLAGAGFAEKRATYVNVTGRLQRANQAVIAPGESRDDWESLTALLSKLDGDYTPSASMDSILNAIASEVEEFSGQSFGSIGDLGVQIIETGVAIPLLEQEKARIDSGQIVG
ncbi:molybdopterin-dependent oxidoreductase [Akkermansiaceae bacterium]|nr:molybdopterin-dependent oxidoreductase [bacterium]MDB4369703.1 molybdopterin-dependent oxidoreductase [Akkermansiaceae bacterium]MDB4382906.1 molybdopterin-dependent oxidoreductase [Akkermansiaceae bacterium]MDB4509418.1 molybdopterin-dependent oxidoreductase [Akkermansiaceae bacterium]